jgi:hypothetical protein
MIFINNCAFLRRIHQIPAGARTVYISRIASSAREPAQTMESKLRTIAKAITWQAELRPLHCGQRAGVFRAA